MLGKGEIEEYSMEKRFLRKDGEVRWGYLTACLLRDINGNPSGFLGNVLDITEAKEMQNRIRHTEKMDAIGKLAGGVAHDFNNLLAVILGFADMLSKRVDPSLKNIADQICIAARRSADLTKQLLAFSRKGQVVAIQINIHEIIQETVNMLNHSIDKRIKIRQNLNALDNTFKGDPTQIQNALLNLSFNARDAMPEGGVLTFSTDVIKIEDKLAFENILELAEGKYIIISVADTGCGIAEKDLSHIFEPFFTTKKLGEGTGMGLSAVYGTVKQYQGDIRVESTVGKGTTIKLYLP